MAAATSERLTLRQDAQRIAGPVAAATKCLTGTIGAINTSGLVVPGAATATLKVAGVFPETYDNTAGAAGDLTATMERGCFKLGNSASTDQITLADYGTTCYVVDNQTVAKTNGSNTRPAAGIVRGVEADGVWVEF